MNNAPFLLFCTVSVLLTDICVILRHLSSQDVCNRSGWFTMTSPVNNERTQ